MKTERIGSLITGIALAVVLVMSLPVEAYLLHNGTALKFVFFLITGPSWAVVFLMAMIIFFPKFDQWVEKTLNRLINGK